MLLFIFDFVILLDVSISNKQQQIPHLPIGSLLKACSIHSQIFRQQKLHTGLSNIMLDNIRDLTSWLAYRLAVATRAYSLEPQQMLPKITLCQQKNYFSTGVDFQVLPHHQVFPAIKQLHRCLFLGFPPHSLIYSVNALPWSGLLWIRMLSWITLDKRLENLSLMGCQSITGHRAHTHLRTHSHLRKNPPIGLTAH